MRTRLLASLLILCAVALPPLAAQQPVPPASPDQPKGATLEGVVVNAMTKEPLRRADVTLMPMPDGRARGGRGGGGGAARAGGFGLLGAVGGAGARRVTTDATGKYAFSGVDPGRYMLRVQRNGFLNATYGQRKPGAGLGTPLEIAAGQAMRDLRILMTPQAIVAGRVVDEEGEPVQNLVVQVLGNQSIRGRRQLVPRGGAQTNDRGEFRLTNVAPGAVYLQVSPPRFAGGLAAGVPDSGQEQGYVPTYYPGVLDASQAVKIDVTPGAELSGFEMKLQKTRVYSITGKIVDESTGESPRNYFVSVTPRDVPFFGPVAQQFNRMPDGSFRVGGVPPGSYYLMVAAGDGRGGMQGRLNHREPVDVTDRNLSGLTVRLPQPVTVQGQVVLRPNSASTALSGLRITAASGLFQLGFQPPATTQENGSFELPGLSPGKYQLTVSGLNAGYVESIRYGGVDVTGAEFEVASGGTPLTVTVATDPSSVSGTVKKDEDLLGGVPVQLVPVEKARRNSLYVKSVQTDQAGGFSMINVAPGSYYVIAPEDADAGFWEDDEVFRRLESRFTRVEVQKNGSHSVEVRAVAVN